MAYPYQPLPNQPLPDDYYYDYETPGPYDDDDDDNADQTGAFVPNGASTPAPEFQTVQKENDGLPELPKAPEDLLTE